MLPEYFLASYPSFPLVVCIWDMSKSLTAGQFSRRSGKGKGCLVSLKNLRKKLDILC